MAAKNCYIFLNLPIFQNEILFWTETNEMKKNDQEYSYDKLIDNTQENLIEVRTRLFLNLLVLIVVKRQCLPLGSYS